MKPNCLVIGAGLSGIFSALFLAHLGYDVDLVEAASEPGPVVRGFRRRGWHFDTGFHYAGGLDSEGVLTRILRFLELMPPLQSIPLSAHGFDRVRFGDGSEDFVFPCGEAELKEALSQRFPDESAGIERFLTLLMGVCDELPLLNLDPGGVPGPLMMSCEGRSLAHVLRSCVSEPGLIRLLELHCLLHGVPAGHIPFAHHAGVIGLYFRSAHALAGGGERLVQVLLSRLKALGVRFHGGEAVTAIDLDSCGAVAGVLLRDGQRLAGQICIATLHPSLLPELLPPKALRPIYQRRLQSLQESGSATFLFGRPRGELPALVGNNLFLDFGSDNGRFGQIYLTRSSGEAKMGVVAICEETDVDGWWGDDYPTRKARHLEEFQAAIADHSPELAAGIEWLDGGTPRTMQRYARSSRCGLYGAAHTIDQINPQPRTRVGGLYLAGQGVAAPGLLGTALSAFWAVTQIDGSRRLAEDILSCS